jgi:hypothetical protein
LNVPKKIHLIILSLASIPKFMMNKVFCPSIHASMIYNSGKFHFTIEKKIWSSDVYLFIVTYCISCLDVLWCLASMLFLLYHDIPFAAKHVTDILENKFDESFLFWLIYIWIFIFLTMHDYVE